MHRFVSWLQASVLAMSVSSCASLGPSSSSAPTTGDFNAFDVGTSWSYAITPGPPAPQSVSIVSRDERGFFVDDRGGRLAPRSDGMFDGERFLLKEPLVPGAEWSAVVRGVTERYRIVATDVQVTVPAGTFDRCVEVEGATPSCDPTTGRAATLRMRWIWAPHVGMVRLRQYVTVHDVPCGTGAVAVDPVEASATPTATMELVTFTPVPASP